MHVVVSKPYRTPKLLKMLSRGPIPLNPGTQWLIRSILTTRLIQKCLTFSQNKHMEFVHVKLFSQFNAPHFRM